MNPQLQQIAALSQLMPQQDPMASLGGLLQLIGGMNELGYREQDQQLKQQQFDQQGQQMQFERGLAERADTRAGSALTLDRMRFQEEAKRGNMAQKKTDADTQYQQRVLAQGDAQQSLAERQLEIQSQARSQAGLMGLMELIASTGAGAQNPQLMSGLLQLALANSGIELPQMPDPQAAQRQAIEQATGSNQVWSPSPVNY